MTSISSSVVTKLILLLCVLVPALGQATVYSALTPKGCFSSSDPMTDQGSWTFQSPGYCQKICVDQNFPVMGTTKGSNCWCGKLLPASNSKVSDSKCSSSCNGYPSDSCKLFISLYNFPATMINVDFRWWSKYMVCPIDWSG